MKGLVITEPLDKESIEAGAVGILTGPDGILGIVTVQHLDTNGAWFVSGDGYAGAMLPDMELVRAMVKTDKESYPLKFNQWKKSIRAGEINTGKEVEFKLQPLKFVKGNYMRECIECTSQFIAHKRQPYCEKCCKANQTAQIVLTKSKPKPATKAKRKRIMTPAKAKMIALEAFKKGLKGDSYQSVENWLDKQL